MGYGAWLLAFGLVDRLSARRAPDRNPLLLPGAALLAGWGVLTIWRVAPDFGLRQSIWLLLGALVLGAGLQMPSHLGILRSYKYLWLTMGLLLTALTLFLGANPSGDGPRLWLGCCGVYFQPSEPLKLLLIVYLAAYLADRQFLIPRLLPLLAPTVLMAGLTILLLVFQRDLGTASIFLFLYTAVAYLATGRRRILLIGLLLLLGAGIAGNVLFDVVRIRMEAWLNPWSDASGNSYQIVQSLIAVASGGIIGTGPGLGSPNVVPVQHSDFIFTAIAEETGLAGALGLISLYALLTAQALRTALRANSSFGRYLAAGLAAYLGGQSILIIGGNLRMLPLTGVTLPFVSYGGSSMLTAFLALLFLLHISSRNAEPAPLPAPQPYLQLSGLLLAGFGALAIFTGWWTIYRGPALKERADNPRRLITDRFVRRGALIDRQSQILARTEGEPGSLTRRYLYPDMGPVVGYTDPTFGRAGLEEALDPYLRGLSGYPPTAIWWHALLYNQPPPGLDVRLSLDLNLQSRADSLLGAQAGAVVLLNAQTGELLVMASHPGFDPNRLNELWPAIAQDPGAPLLNRATLGRYRPAGVLGPFLLAAVINQGQLPALPEDQKVIFAGGSLDCSGLIPEDSWAAAVASGCPAAVRTLALALSDDDLRSLYEGLGFFSAPQILLPTGQATAADTLDLLDPVPFTAGDGAVFRLSPLQIALAAASLSTEGLRPTPRLAMAYLSPAGMWTAIPPTGQPTQALPAAAARQVSRQLEDPQLRIWQVSAIASDDQGGSNIWYVAGTPPNRTGPPLVMVLLLEANDPKAAVSIGQALMSAALQP